MTAAFVVGSALLSTALVMTTYLMAHHYLLSQREKSAQRQSYANARLVQQDLKTHGADVTEVLSTLTPIQGTRLIVYRSGRWYSVPSGVIDLPRNLVRAAKSGHPSLQLMSTSSQTAITVGLPLPAVGAEYFEVHSLAELSSTLHVLASILAAAALATMLGGVFVGRWASGRLVRPLVNLTRVAGAVGRGDLAQRLPADDPDLDPLVDSFNEMVSALQGRIQRDARFVSDVSHELRSPLTTVSTSVELLQLYRDELPPEAEKALDLLDFEIGRFSAVVKDLLEISRIDAGAAIVDLEQVQLHEFVTEAIYQCTNPTVPLQVEPPAQGLVVCADRRRLQQVIVNLLDNARTHGGGAVLVSLLRDRCMARIVIDDAGPGVPEQDRERIFERFYRGAAAGRRGQNSGAGLGLALAAEHMRVQNGALTVGERPGGGARFVLGLPLTVDDGGASDAVLPMATGSILLM